MWKTNSLNSRVCYSTNCMPNCSTCPKFYTVLTASNTVLHFESSKSYSQTRVAQIQILNLLANELHTLNYHHGDLVMGWLFSDVSSLLWSSVCCQISIYHVVYIHQLPWIQNNLQVLQSLFYIIPTTACSKSDLNVGL
jgi:hypothetical protein